jgi:hypothetical protein
VATGILGEPAAAAPDAGGDCEGDDLMDREALLDELVDLLGGYFDPASRAVGPTGVDRAGQPVTPDPFDVWG